MSLQRIPYATIAMIVDFVLTGTLVISMWGELRSSLSIRTSATILMIARLSVFPYLRFSAKVAYGDLLKFWAFDEGSIPGWETFYQAIRFGIPSFCFLYMAVLLVAPFISTNAAKSYYAIPPSRIPSSQDKSPLYLRLCGPLRDVSGRRELERRCSSVIFRHTVARKHPCVQYLAYLVVSASHLLNVFPQVRTSYPRNCPRNPGSVCFAWSRHIRCLPIGRRNTRRPFSIRLFLSNNTESYAALPCCRVGRWTANCHSKAFLDISFSALINRISAGYD